MQKSALAMLAVILSLTGTSIAAPWAVPGGACTQEGANANSDGFLTCTGGVWVSNAVLLGTTSATCDSTKAGYIRYTGGQFEGCNGTGWIQLASSGAPTYLGVTATSYTGNLGGFPGGNAKCVTDFGTGARMMSLGDVVRMGRSTTFPATGWMDCRAEASFAMNDTAGAFACGSSTVNGSTGNADCSSQMTASGSMYGFIMLSTGSVSAAACSTSRPIHCVKD
jgi:hypothetical protein